MSVVEIQEWAAVVAIVAGIVTLVGGFAAVLIVFNRTIDEFRNEIKADNEGIRAELKADNEAIRAELKADNEAIRAELKADNEATRAELKADNEATRAELKAEMVGHFHEVNSRLQVLEQRTYDIGSRLPAVNG